MIYRFIFSLVLILSSVQTGIAQLIISGQVRDNITAVGVPNHQVNIVADTSYLNTLFYTKTLSTNNQGYFSDTIYFVNTQSKFFIITQDCNLNFVVDSIFTIVPAPVNLDICTGGINMCISDFIAYYDSSDYQLIHFYNLSSFNATSYLWDFGDGNFAVSQHPNHHYNLGTYQVCLTITDSTTNCTDTYCDSITIIPTMNCNTSYTYSLVGSKKYSFVANINNVYPTIYNWDFGDYSIGNGKYIVHQYQQPGSYVVKLTSTSFHPQTLDTCISHYQQTIQVSGAPTAGLWGQVFADSSRIDHGVVYLYSYDNSTHYLSIVDSTNVQKIDSLNISYYLFTNLNYGKYAIYLKLLSNSIYYQDYGPSYSGNTIYWDDCQTVDLNKVSTILPINLTHLYKQSATSTISGHIYEGNKASAGDPIGGMPIFILDNSKVIVDFQYSEADGSYTFEHLNPQKYFIYTDAINHSIYPASAIITSQNQNINNIDIYITSSMVTSLEERKLPINFKLYPNPSSGVLNIEFSNPQVQTIKYEITNLLGQVVFSSSAITKQGVNITKFNLSYIYSGVYIFSIKVKENTIYRKKLIITN